MDQEKSIIILGYITSTKQSINLGFSIKDKLSTTNVIHKIINQAITLKCLHMRIEGILSTKTSACFVFLI
jgi:hypothetical protein